MADALGAIAVDEASKAKSNADYQTTQSQIVQTGKQELAQSQNALASSQRAGDKTRSDLDKSRSDLAVSQQDGQKTAMQLSAELAAHADAERRATEAQDALAKLAAVKQEERGMVITLSGSVLFPSDKSTLLPDAETRLNQVAAALMSTTQRKAVVEGYTDSRGSESHNLDLSQRRAESVRSYFISRGYDSNLISAVGFGKGKPVSDNSTAEGRANNRRVEIIVSPRDGALTLQQ